MNIESLNTISQKPTFQWSIVQQTSQKVHNILDKEDFELLFLDLLDEILPEPIEINEYWDEIYKSVKCNFWVNGHYKIEIKSGVISIEMIQMPTKWVEAMLSIIRYAYENGLTKIKWEANPQKKHSSDMNRRVRLLVSFYTSFWCKPELYSKTGGKYMVMNLSEPGLLEVLYKKTKIFQETWKWPILYTK